MKIIAKRRKIEGKTNYLKRKKLLENQKMRIVVRKTNRYIIIQSVESSAAQDKVVLSVISKDLLNLGWSNAREGSLKSLPAAYLTGFLFGNLMKKKAEKEKHVKNADYTVDTGLIRSTAGSRMYATIKGVIDSGIKVKCNEKMFPEEKRIKNDKVGNFFDKIKDNINKSGEK